MKDLNIPQLFAGIGLSVVIALQGWILTEQVAMRERVARIETRVDFLARPDYNSAK